MKSLIKIGLLSLLIGFVVVVHGQQPNKPGFDSKNSLQDTTQVNYLLQQSEIYFFSNPDTCLAISLQAAELAKKINFKIGEIHALNNAGEALRYLGEFPQSLEMQFRALEMSKAENNKERQAASLAFMGYTYIELKEHREALNHLFKANDIYNKFPASVMGSFTLSNIGNSYEELNMLDSATFFQQQAMKKVGEAPHKHLDVLILTRLGIIYSKSGKHERALHYFHSALRDAILIADKVQISKIQNWMAKIFLTLNQKDSSLVYARQAFASAQYATQKLYKLEAVNLLIKLFRDQNSTDSIIHYQDMAIAMNDSLFGPDKFKQLQLLMLEEQQRQQEILQEQESYRNRIKIIALLSVVGIFLIIAIILYINYRQKQKTNKVLESTLANLKSTQSQLIQSEKMASLGELTAGIAHEIQNPLNFVNNFSEVNTELIEELKTELKAGNNEDAIAIANDIADNEEKINHHGKRADTIVKGMLQHSRSSSGIKEPTNINALADEYLRLAYHGLRAKDKTFNASMKTDFDETIGNINIVPQDIGRVVLNLFTNAFYAITEKKKRLGDNYEPIVTVSTRALKPPLGGLGVEIKIADNGNGIPQKILDKIFQPFFTTKPTGQGTGLGLSLAYDIVKAHGGEIKVVTKEKEGTEFIIVLPA